MPDGHDQQHTCYRASSAPDRHRQLRGAIDHDACIVGAGFAGLGAALSRVERGRTDMAGRPGTDRYSSGLFEPGAFHCHL